MSSTPDTKEPSFEGFYHLRTKSGLELLGQLYYVKENVPVLYFPVKVLYTVGTTIGVKFVPYNLLTDDEFFTFTFEDVEFLSELNARTRDRYLNYVTEFDTVKSELDQEYEDVLTDKKVPEGTILH